MTVHNPSLAAPASSVVSRAKVPNAERQSIQLFSTMELRTGHKLDVGSALTGRHTTKIQRPIKLGPLFDHLVGAGKQLGRHGEAERAAARGALWSQSDRKGPFGAV